MPGRDIFLSYSSEDETIVGLALEKLEAAGHRCWFAPRDIPPGEFYAGQIIQALRESRFVLLFFSAHSNGSEQVVREINFAVSQRLPLLVVRLDQTALSNHFEYLIRVNQWLDVSHLSSDAERIDKIVAQVETSLAKSGPKTSTAKAPIAMVFGDFQILADSSGKPIELGRGGMGVTYRARQVSMGGREVALKVIQPELLGDDNVRRRFLREAQLAGEIDHENVALVYLRGQEGDSYFYAMQLVEGVDLDRLVKAKGPLNVRDALSVVAQMASALAAANSKGLIHRDIKPSNIMAVRRRNMLRIKLIDFGLAKQITQQDIHSSLSGKDEFKGTLAYASPEQCQAFPLDTRSDLYSLGVALWFLLSGKVPFTGNLAAVSGAHVWAPLPLQQLPPLPEAVLQLLKSLLAKNPADRPQTPGELEDRAEALLRSLPSDSVSDSAAIQVEPAASSDGSVGPEADSTLIGAPVLVSYLEPAAGQIREDRFELLESLPEGVSGRLFRARERRGSESRIVAVKFLHPSICAQEEATECLKTQFAALQKLTLDHLIRYFALELSSTPPFLAREWVQGIPLTGVLRLRAGTLTPPEVSILLEPLPGLLDALASSGLSLITVRLSKLWARLPPELDPAKFESWVKQATAPDWGSRLALDPLSLRSLVPRPVQSESDVTLLPTSRSLALQQNRAGIQGRTPAQLLASVVYELLAGQPPHTDSYRPLAAIPDWANQRLKRALAHDGPDRSSASELWVALKADFPEAPKVSIPTHRRQSDPDPSTGSTPPSPAEPATKPQPPPTPDTSGSQKTKWTRLGLILGSLAVFVCIILLGFWLSSHSTPPKPSPSPTPEPVSPTPTAAPTPSPEEAARLAIQQAAKEKPWINSLGMKFVPVPGTQAFFSIWDTRVQDFKAFVTDSGYDATGGTYSLGKDGWKQQGATWESPGFKQGPEYPVAGVSWDDAKAFCAWLTNKEHAAGRLPQDMVYRLPTDEEWSMAVGLGHEAGDTPKEKDGKIAGVYPWGKQWPPPKGAGNYAGDEVKTVDWPNYPVINGYNDGWPRTSPVGAFAANRLGLYDISGNVWQWCEDWYDNDKKFRVLRGGSWVNDNPDSLLSSFRVSNSPDLRLAYYGFRCVVAPGSSR